MISVLSWKWGDKFAAVHCNVLAAALARANPPVVLPVFQQYASLERRDDEIHHTGPLPLFESHSRLASVNLRPGGDGLVRQYSLTQSATDNMYLSMGAAFATVQQPSSDGFYLDFGIRPETIPYVSFGDVLDGKVDPAQLRDKFVLVGATAIELGDNVPAPIYRALPGVTLQALAYESIVQGRMLLRSSSSVTWIVALVLAVLAGARFQRWFWVCTWLGTVAGVGFLHWLLFESLYSIGILCPYCLLDMVGTIPLFFYTTMYCLKQGVLPLSPRGRRTLNPVQEFHWVFPVTWYLVLALLILIRFWSYWKTLV